MDNMLQLNYILSFIIFIASSPSVSQRIEDDLKDPACTYTHCKKPVYDILEIERSCRPSIDYAKCLRAALKLCIGKSRAIHDWSAVDELTAVYDAAKHIVILSGANCRFPSSGHGDFKDSNLISKGSENSAAESASVYNNDRDAVKYGKRNAESGDTSLDNRPTARLAAISGSIIVIVYLYL